MEVYGWRRRLCWLVRMHVCVTTSRFRTSTIRYASQGARQASKGVVSFSYIYATTTGATHNIIPSSGILEARLLHSNTLYSRVATLYLELHV